MFSLGMAVLSFTSCNQQSPNSSTTISNLSALVAASPDTLKQLDIVRMNLICAERLPGAEQLHITNSLAVIDQMAGRGDSELTLPE